MYTNKFGVSGVTAYLSSVKLNYQVEHMVHPETYARNMLVLLVTPRAKKNCEYVLEQG